MVNPTAERWIVGAATRMGQMASVQALGVVVVVVGGREAGGS